MSPRLGRRAFLAAAGAAAAIPALARAQDGAASATIRVNMETAAGLIVLDLEAAKAPVTVANFLRYVDAGRYNGGNFYRALKSAEVPDWGLIQGGVNPTAARFPAIAHEPTNQTGLLNKAGAIAMARNAPGTATSEFFICVSDQPGLDADPMAEGDNAGFAAFGYVVEGMDVVKKIQSGPTDAPAPIPAMQGQMLNEKITITRVTRA